MKYPGAGRKFAASAVSAVMAIFLILPNSVTAKEKRGARLVVTMLDGRQAEGELIAVRPESLLLLSFVGRYKTVDLAGVQTVRIVRKSHAGVLALGGFVAGAVGGAIYGSQVGEDSFDKPALVLGAFYGALGALAGLALSIPAGLDTTFQVAGEPEELVKSRLEKLARFSRESRNPTFSVPAEAKLEPAPQKTPAIPSAPASSPPRPPRRPRFKIAVSETLAPKQRRISDNLEGYTFRFTGDVPLEEAGPHPVFMSHYQAAGMNRMAVGGPVSLAYEWTKHWSTEIELFMMNPGRAQSDLVTLEFTSTADGKTYHAGIFAQYYADFDSLLVGLSYRPLAPTPLDRHAFEAGVAIGPAWIKTMPIAYMPYLPADRKVVLSGRIQASYDLYFIPALSLGASLGYRYLEAKFAGSIIQTELVFQEEGNNNPSSITRWIELNLPGRSYSRSSFFLALRIGLRI